ncbi:MAG: FecR domain-containing protein [Opitutaceae bacterium]
MKFSLLRFLLPLLACAFVGLPSASAQAPAGGRLPPGVVLVAKVEGRVEMTVNGQTTALAVDMQIPQAAKVVTFADAATVLVFSNGATTRLGADTELVLEEFLQDPFGATVKVSELQEEPSTSVTSLRLNRGELVGDVKKLKYGQGSSFTINTPVGAAGIRGTTFRIVFRPSGSGQAFFSLTTATGNVVFQQGQQGGAPSTPTPGAGQTQGQTQPQEQGTPQQQTQGQQQVQAQQGQGQQQGQNQPAAGSGGTASTSGGGTGAGGARRSGFASNR